jgi:phosphoribosylformylglycinamidine cyclo-ligase
LDEVGAVALTFRGNIGEPARAGALERFLPLARWTRTPEVIDGVAAALYGLPPGVAEPVLVSATAGLGAKSKIASAAGKHDLVGADLVAACINDVVVSGARPLFFMQRYGCGKLDLDLLEQVTSGVAEACRNAGCALLGGETNEQPGVYADTGYDLSGFALGVVARSELLGKERITAGDHLVAVAANGLHAEGHAVARRVLEQDLCLWMGERVEALGCTVAEALLEPMRIYGRAALALRAALGNALRAIAHVGPGGIPAAVARVVPDGMSARIDLESYERPPIFGLLSEQGHVKEEELRHEFGLGVGLIAIVGAEASFAAVEALEGAGETAWMFGDVRTGAGAGPRVVFTG